MSVRPIPSAPPHSNPMFFPTKGKMKQTWIPAYNNGNTIKIGL